MFVLHNLFEIGYISTKLKDRKDTGKYLKLTHSYFPQNDSSLKAKIQMDAIKQQENIKRPVHFTGEMKKIAKIG